jgi:hypothetical protein
LADAEEKTSGLLRPTTPDGFCASDASVDPRSFYGSRFSSRFPDALGIAWVLTAGVAVLLPALLHGAYLGPYDILSTTGLTAQKGATVHNPSLRDLIALFIPFTQVAWTQVHQGHIPLWNPDSALGMPLAFNWESAPFGLPALVGYLVPLRLAYTVGVIVTVAVAGTGAYVFARALKLGVIAATFVGTVFVLSGPMVALLGWSATSVGSWTGWLFATATWVIRGKRRAYAVAGFAVAIALTVYAGHPETAILVFLGLALYLFLVPIRRLLRHPPPSGLLRPVLDLAIAGAAGVALSAPLILPGLELIARSGRSATGNYDALTTPDHAFLQLLFQGFDGLPVAGSRWFGSLSYQWTAAYVGVIALVMAIVALATRWKRPEVLGLTGLTALMAVLILVPGVPSVVSHLPLLGEVILTRALIPLAFGISVLAGFGVDALVRDHTSRRVQLSAFFGFLVAALVLIITWTFARGELPHVEARIRTESFIWPIICVLAGLLVVAGLSFAIGRNPGRRHFKAARAAAGAFLVLESAFLVSSGATLWTSSSSTVTPPSVDALKKDVGTSLVGLGSESCIASTFLGAPALGILPQANLLYGVHEFAIYDPLTPVQYYSTWKSLTGSEGGNPFYYQFCPAISDVAAARRFGVSFVLENLGVPGPTGTQFIGRVGSEALYRIPGAASATLTPAPEGQPLPPADRAGIPVAVREPRPSTWTMHVDARTAQVLRLRLTDVPGWTGTIDGHSLGLRSFSGIMMQARISYWPTAFTEGLILAILSASGLLIAIIWTWARRRSRDQT